MSDDKKALREIAERENAFYAGLAASDADALDEIMSDELTYVHSTGIAETKAENLAGQRRGLYVHGPITRLSGETEVFGNGAITVGIIDMINLARGVKTTLRLHETLIWAKEAAVWRLYARHATRLPL